MRIGKKTYSGVNTISLTDSEVCIDSRFSPLKWDNFLSRVTLMDITSREGGSGKLYINQNGKTLHVGHARASVYVPYGRTTDIFANNKSQVSGRFFSGNLHSDETSSVKVNVPYNFPRKLGPVGSALSGVIGDLSYIVLTALPIAAVGVPLIKFFGGAPVDYIDEFLLLSAGVNVGFRGESKRTFLTCLTVAGASIFGPEAREAMTKGLEAGLDSLGWEDVLKGLFHLGAWGIGKCGRDYYIEKTKRH